MLHDEKDMPYAMLQGCTWISTYSNETFSHEKPQWMRWFYRAADSTLIMVPFCSRRCLYRVVFISYDSYNTAFIYLKSASLARDSNGESVICNQ